MATEINGVCHRSLLSVRLTRGTVYSQIFGQSYLVKYNGNATTDVWVTNNTSSHSENSFSLFF